MNLNAMSHATDPITSKLAAESTDANVSARLRDALLILLDEKPRTADELTAVYFHKAEMERWPLLEDAHNVKRRLSELHSRHHVIRESGERRPSRQGKASTVWELAVPVEEARLIVGAA
jgi:hypothetical protein